MPSGSVKSRFVFSAIELSNAFDFEKYKSVLELGCGPMAQAFVLQNMFPHLQIKATDFDPLIMENLSEVSLLRNIEKEVVDIDTFNPEIIGDFDLLMTWGVEYVFNENQIMTQSLRQKPSDTGWND